ncbi:diuretic hormone receptor-like [Uloborus diversus]|uniref:diuretic hormone receptor-like n=1 Tax=Uloborus diversus TaxID=327109 RepID=UPI00240A74AE|nr:diuretic hormone receptor-like [Uloborus diversus]
MANIWNDTRADGEESMEELFSEEKNCKTSYENFTKNFEDHLSFCSAAWDGLSCWPAVNAGSVATVPCFHEFNGVLYDTLENATRTCSENGTWAKRSDYSRCKPLLHEESHIKVLWDIKEAGTIYYVGYGMSLLALMAALSIFIHFKNLRCLRNNIHTNLLATYFFLDLTWIITATLQSLPSVEGSKVTCILVILLTYLMVTNFFWMFVEGLYLYILAVKTFSIEVVRIHVYALIGWGVPALIVVSWASVKGYLAPLSKDSLVDDCVWQTKDSTDYIFICPVIVVLLVNVFFMCKIMWVLMTKLRIATTAESKQYRKAAKALLVLIPLLGMTYVLVIVTPTHRTARVVFSYLQAVLLSTQGFTVAILYCFLNGEVQKSMHHLLRRWTTRRTVHGSQRYSLSYRSSQYDRDNNLKLYRSTRGTQNRSSCASFTTTTTTNWPSNCNRCD